MNANAIAKHYASLTAQERFRLIYAAGARGDKAEQGRLVCAGRSITLSMPEHTPHAHAFGELSLHTFLFLLDEAASYYEAFELSREAEIEVINDDESEDTDAEEVEAEDIAEEEDSPVDKWFRSALVIGFLLKTEGDGWKLFCERLSIPPFADWNFLPGFHRLQCALAGAEKAAFVPEGMVRWLNSRRPTGKPELTALPPHLTSEGIADTYAEWFQARVKWWGG